MHWQENWPTSFTGKKTFFCCNTLPDFFPHNFADLTILSFPRILLFSAVKLFPELEPISKWLVAKTFFPIFFLASGLFWIPNLCLSVFT
jgi:hypothetical protein